ncbi:MAG TPA: circadian clock protein KaiC [Polyangiaceae bacterium]
MASARASRGPGSRLQRAAAKLPVIEKVPTGISGFDEITFGGLPKGRTTLICGAAGCGKTLFGMQFLTRGALDHGESGVFIAFEETEDDLVRNVASLGLDLEELKRKKLLEVDHVHVERSQIEEAGEYSLDGLFLRLDAAIRSVGAKRVVIDTLEVIFGGLSNTSILRSELKRLFAWLKDRGVTTVVTAERGEGSLTRHGLEEYVSDCVVVLDHRVLDQVSTRRIRVVKYRGSTHGSNEYPFLIDSTGLTVVPITSAELEHRISDERVSSGVPSLDAMLGGEGYYRGSTVLLSGTAGAGKSSLCAHFAAATCRNKERCIYVSYEESASQIQRNMGSIGIDLARFVQQGLLRIQSMRPTSHGLEGHLALLHKLIKDVEPSAVIIDPIGTLVGAGNSEDAHLMLVRLIDLLKTRGITSILSNLTHGGESAEQTSLAVSSLVDTWLLVRSLESNGERNRGLYVLKSRGMAHSNQIREFVITRHGVELVEPYVGPEGVLTGSARIAQQNRDKAEKMARASAAQHRKREIERKRAELEQRIAALRAEFSASELEFDTELDEVNASERAAERDQEAMRILRGGKTYKPEGAQKRTNGTRVRAAD